MGGMWSSVRPVLAWVVVVLALLAGCAGRDAAPERQAQVAHGEALYDTHCIDCHGGATGGDIADVPPPHNAQGHTWHHGDCELIAMTLQGLPERPGLPDDVPPMPGFANELDEDDVRAILAHIRTWWTPEQRAHQERVTAQVCE